MYGEILNIVVVTSKPDLLCENGRQWVSKEVQTKENVVEGFHECLKLLFF